MGYIIYNLYFFLKEKFCDMCYELPPNIFDGNLFFLYVVIGFISFINIFRINQFTK